MHSLQKASIPVDAHTRYWHSTCSNRKSQAHKTMTPDHAIRNGWAFSQIIDINDCIKVIQYTSFQPHAELMHRRRQSSPGSKSEGWKTTNWLNNIIIKCFKYDFFFPSLSVGFDVWAMCARAHRWPFFWRLFFGRFSFFGYEKMELAHTHT